MTHLRDRSERAVWPFFGVLGRLVGLPLGKRWPIVFVIICLAFGFRAKAATITSTATGGNWNVAGTWVGGVVPVAADIVIIADGATVNITAAAACTNLTVGQGTSGILQFTTANINITVSGTTTISAGGTVNLATTTTGTRLFTGDFTNGGTWNNAGNSTVTFGGNITNNGTFISGTGINTLNGAAKSINGAFQFTSLTVSNTYTNNGSLTVTTTFAGGSTLTNAASGVLMIGAATVTPTLNATAAGNTVNYVGIVAQTVKGTTYSNLTINNPGFTATAGAATVANVLTVTAGTFATGNFALTSTTTQVSGVLAVNGATGAKALGTVTVNSGGQVTASVAAGVTAIDITVSTGGTWNETAAMTLNASGNIVVDGTFTAGTGVHTLSGATKTVEGSISILAIPNLTVSGTYTSSVPILSVPTALAGAGALTLGANTQLNIGGTSAITGLNCTANIPNEVVYNGTVAQTVKLTTYYNLTINKALNTATLAAGTTNVDNNLAVVLGTLADLTTASITGNGVGTFSVADGAVYKTVKTTGNFFPTVYTVPQMNFNTTGGFEYGAAGAVSIPVTPLTAYGKLIISGSGIKTLQTATTVNALEINAGTLADGGNQISGQADGTCTMAANTGLTLGSVTTATLFPMDFTTGNITFQTTSTVTYNSNLAQTISPVPVYANLALLSTAAVTKTLSGNTNVLTNVNIGANNTLDMVDNTLSVAGATPFTVNATNGFLKADDASAVVRFNGSGSTQQLVTIAAARLIGGYIYNLECAHTGTSLTRLVSTSMQVRNVTINSGGILELNGVTLSVNGTYTNNGTIQALTANSYLEMNGTFGAQNLALGNSSGTTIFIRLRVNNNGDLTLTGPALVGGLDFTAGLLNTDGTNLLTIYGNGTVTGASASGYVNGPMARRFASGTTAGTHVYPLGKSGLNSFAVTAPAVTGITDIRAEVFDAACGGTGSSGLTNLSTNRYWQASVTSGSLTSISNVQLTESGLVSTQAIGQSATLSGTYNLLGGALTANVLTSEIAVNPSLGYFAIGDRVPLSGTVQVGPGSADGLFSLTANGGLFQAINLRGLNGNLTAHIIGDISIEDGTHALNQWAEYAGTGYTLGIRSNGPARTISGTYNGTTLATNGLFRLNGADRVTIDGGTGTSRLLTFRNTNTGAAWAATFSFINDASNNQLNNLVIEGGSTSSITNGVVYFGTGATTGNDDNLIQRCDIRDLTTATSYPFSLVFGLGSSATITNDNVTIDECNLFNYYGTTSTPAAVRISTGCKAWTVNNNHIYQTLARTGAITNEHYGIHITNTASGSGVGYTITGNVIGYASAAETGTMTYNSSGAFRMAGIYLDVASSGITNTVSGNRIQNILQVSTSGANTANGVFSGIYLNNGWATITGNTIGSFVANGSLSLQSSSNGAAFFGIRNASTGNTVTVTNNTIGGMSVSQSGATANTGLVLHGISSSAGALTVTGNQIGSGSLADNFTVSGSNATSNPVSVMGIVLVSGAAYSNTVSDNRITSMTSVSTSSGGQMVGVNMSGGGQFAVSNNRIWNLRSAGGGIGTGTSASLIGIALVTGNTQACTVNDNDIYALQNTNTANAACIVTGIAYNGGTSVSNTIANNAVHSFTHTSTSATAQQFGIEIVTGSGIVTVSNNFVRLGIRPDGTDHTLGNILTGIADNSVTAQSIFFNTVYIAGAATGTANTYAYRRSQTTGADMVRNNLFANSRTGGSGAHFANALNTTANLSVMNNNVYLGALSTVAVPTVLAAPVLQRFRAALAVSTGQDLNSGIATLSQINFRNAGADTSAVDLRLNDANCASGAGMSISSIASDFDGTVTRASLPAIGAHESATFNPLNTVYDIYTPIVSIAPVSNLSAACGSNQTVTITATVTDQGSGLATAVLAPTLWWRESTGTYAPLLPSSSAGNVFTYTLNLTGITGGLTYHYYVAAQDRAAVPNIWYSHFTATEPVHANVSATPTPAIAVPATFSVIAGTPLSGTVTVGTGGTYPSFNGALGLFAAINTNGLGGDLTAQVISDISETAYTPLTAVSSYCGGPWTLLVQPVDATVRTVSGSTGQSMLVFNGASHITVDGRFGGSGQYLVFRNTQAHPAFWLNGGAHTINIRNSLIESSNVNSTAGAGVMVLGGPLAVGSTGVRKISIDNNTIRYRTTGAFGGYSKYMILSSNVGAANDSISITNNNISDWSIFSGGSGYSAAISVQANGGSNYTISGNSLFSTFIDGTGQQFGIDFRPGAASTGNLISGNYIGGSAPLCGGANAWRNNTGNDLFPVYLNVGSNATRPTVLSNNTIQKIEVQGGSASSGGITGIEVVAGRVNILDNTIGHASLINNLLSSGGGMLNGNSGWTYGIYSTTADSLVIERNLIGGLASTGSYQSYCTMIEHIGNGIVYMDNNVLGNSYNGASVSGWNTVGVFINNGAQGHYINRLQVQNLGGSSGAPDGTEADGVILRGTCSGTLSNSKISNFFHLGNGGWSAGIALAATGNWTVSNNMVNMLNRSFQGITYTTRKDFYAVYDIATSGNHTYYNNTVLVQGSQTGTSSVLYPYGSACFYKLPNGSGSGNGANVELRNNVLINARTGNPNSGTRHYAVDNTSTSPSVNWNLNYNLLASSNAGWLGYWNGAGDRTFTQWLTSSAGDASSWSVTTTTGTSSATELNPTDLFMDVANGDLSIRTSGQAAWFVNGKGVAGVQNGNLQRDFHGDIRTTIYGWGIDLGADEFTPDAGVLPHALTATPSAGGTNTFSFAGRTIAGITWGTVGGMPGSITGRYFSGDAPGTTPSPAYGGLTKADFMTEFVPMGGTGYTYQVTLNYDDALLGDYVATESSMRMIKTLSTSWIDVTSGIDTVANQLTTTAALDEFSFFSGGVAVTDPLPVALLGFEAICDEGTVKLKWTTASEINNERFYIHRSPDLVTWEEVATINGAGNSNEVLAYGLVDERPLGGSAYYRLSQTDYDGTSETFAPVHLYCAAAVSGNSLWVYPNPATDYFTVSVNVNQAVADAGIEILDMNGKTIIQRSIVLNAGTNDFLFGGEALRSGTYIIRLKSNGLAIKPVRLIIR